MNNTLLNKKVEEWWNSNPFSYGIVRDNNQQVDQVGSVPESEQNLSYFNEIERKFRKHTRDASQNDDEPLFSKLINYDWVIGKKVLDIATGSGFSLVEFLRMGAAEVKAIDLTSFAIGTANKNMRARGLNNGEAIKMDAQDLKFADNTFDYVHAWGCYMHMPDTEKALSESCRVLKNGGHVMAYMYNRDSWPFWFNTFFLKGILKGDLIRYKGNITNITSRYSDGVSRGGNPLAKFYRKSTIKKMFEKAGFKNVVVKPFRIPEEPDGWPMKQFPFFKYFPAIIKKFLTNFGYGIIIVAEK